MSSDHQRVLLCVNEAQRTGTPISALRMLEVLRDRQVETLVAIKRGGPLVPRFEAAADRAIVRPGGVLEPLLSQLRWRGPVWVPPVLELAIAERLRRRQRPDVVVAESVVTADYARMAVEAGIPTLFSCREQAPVVARFLDAYRARPALMRTRLVANSQATARQLAAELDVPPDHVRVIYPPVDIAGIRELALRASDPGLPDDRPVVVGVGSLRHRKGPDLWIEVAAQVVEAVPEALFVWAGGGSSLARYRGEVRAKGLAHAVRFVGELANPYPLVAQASASLVTSRVEPLSRFAIESRALGTPVVAFDTGGVSEPLDGAGLLVTPFDVDAMASRVIALLRRPSMARELAEMGSAGIERFDLPAYDEAVRAELDLLL